MLNYHFKEGFMVLTEIQFFNAMRKRVQIPVSKVSKILNQNKKFIEYLDKSKDKP